MESFKKTGTWWLPASKATIKGTLTFDEKDGIFLQADSFFPGVLHSMTTSFPIIYGEANRKKYTLINAYAHGPHGERTGYQPAQLLEGHHLTDLAETFVTGVSFACDDLHKWLKVSGFRQPIIKTKKIATVKYAVPKSIDFKIGTDVMGSFIFSHDVKGKITSEVRITQDVQTKLDFSDGLLSYDAALSKFVAFYQFLTFAIQKPPYIKSVTLQTKEKINKRWKTSYVNFYFKARANDDDFNAQFLFYKDELINFDKVISQWFFLDEKISPSIRILFETYFADVSFNENSFLNQAQAIETFHRSLYPPTEEEKQNFTVRIKRITDQIGNKEDQELLTAKFQYGYEPSFKKRLDTLIAKVKDVTAVTDLKLDNKFVRQVIENRNYYTHYGFEKNSLIVEGTALARLTVRVKILLIVLFLHELGFDHKLIDSFIKGGRFSNWAFLMSPHQ